MLRRFIALFVLVSIIYFPVGWFLVTKAVLAKDVYFSIAAIVGTLASIVSLIASFRSSLSEDLENLDSVKIDKIANASKQIEKLGEQKIATEEEIQKLTRTKQEMETLIKKASMALFLHEEQKKVEASIVSELEKNQSLMAKLSTYREYKVKLQKLDEEIDSHPDAALVYEIIDYTRKDERNLKLELLKAVEDIPVWGRILEPVLRIIFITSESMIRAANIVLFNDVSRRRLSRRRR